MASNYNKTGTSGGLHDFKAEVLTANGVLETAVVTQILKGLGAKITEHTLAASDVTVDHIKGNQVVAITGPGTVDLSTLTAKEAAAIAPIKDFLFLDHNTPVHFTLGPDADTNGKFALNFNGNVVTEGGDDIITIHSKGNVYVASGSGNDTITTGSGNDTVLAGTGDDSISTGKGNDSISTGTGQDTVDAGAGNDTIYVGAGNDGVRGEGKGVGKVIYGGAGNDIVKLAAGYTGNATIDGAGGESNGLVKATDLDKLDLSKVVITNVDKVDDQGHLTITLNDGSILDVQHFEKFVYDTSTADQDGAIKLTGLEQFYAQFHHTS